MINLKVWRHKAPTKGGLGACPQQAVNPAVAHGASRASRRGEGPGSKACERTVPTGTSHHPINRKKYKFLEFFQSL